VLPMSQHEGACVPQYLVKSFPSDYIKTVGIRVPKKLDRDRKECRMDTRGKETYGSKGPVEWHCDSRRCYKCFDGVCEERFEDLVFGVGP
jgi:hypothetical protein